MDEERIALQIGRIRRALEEAGKEVNEQEIRAAYLDMWLNHGLEEERAVRKVLESYGVKMSAGGSTEMKLDSLVPGLRATVRGKVISINRAVSSRDGEEVVRYYGILRDDTGSAPFNAWGGSQLEGIEKGDSVEMEGVLISEWNGSPQIRIVRSSTVKKVELDFDIPQSGGGQRGPAEEVKLSEVAPGKRISFTARVFSIDERKINARGEEKTIYSGLLADESAKVPFTAWKDFGLRQGDVIRVEGAYVREWRGTPQINLDEGMDVEKVSSDMPSIEELDRGTSVRIWEIEERGGMNDVVVSASVVQVKKGSGLIFRCPECRWVLQDGVCKKHGRVKGVPDLRIKAVLDDGTGTLNMVAGAEITSEILGMSIDECVEEAKERMDMGMYNRILEEMLTARPVLVRGNVVADDMSTTLIAREMSFREEDPLEDAERLIEEWGV